MHLRGDIYWWHGGSGRNNHVGIYIGNGKMIDCSGKHLDEHSVKVRSVPKTANHERKIIHFDRFPKDPSSYFDLETQTMVYKDKGRENETSVNNSKSDNNKAISDNTNDNITIDSTTTLAKNVMKIEFLDPTEEGRKHDKNFGDCTIISSEGEYIVVDTFNSAMWDVVKKHLDEKENDENIKSRSFNNFT